MILNLSVRDISFLSTITGETSNVKVCVRNKMLLKYHELTGNFVSANGDGACDLQVSVAALSVYWMVQLVTA
jgi:hypothetical protein